MPAQISMSLVLARIWRSLRRNQNNGIYKHLILGKSRCGYRLQHQCSNANSVPASQKWSPNELRAQLSDRGFTELDKQGALEESMLYYLWKINPGYQRNIKKWNQLLSELKDATTNATDRLLILWNYILEQSRSEIDKINDVGPDGIKRLLKPQSKTQPKLYNISNEFDEAIVDKLVASDVDPDSLIPHTELFVKLLKEMLGNPNIYDMVPLALFAESFELMKIVPLEQLRLQGLYLSGKLLYNSKKVKLDPVNESFFIESLLHHGDYKSAWVLFSERKSTLDQRWWYELGMLIALRSNKIKKFELLLKDYDAKYIIDEPYVSPKILKVAIRRYLMIERLEKARLLTARFLTIIKKFGFEIQNHREAHIEKTRTFDDENDIYEKLNEFEKPTDRDFVSIIDYFLHKKKVDDASRLMAKFLEIPGMVAKDNSKVLLTRTKLNLLSDFSEIRTKLARHMTLDEKLVELKLNQFESAFKEISQNYKINTSGCHDLLFENISALVSSPKLTKLVESLIIQHMAEDGQRDNALALKSSRYQNLIEYLLFKRRYSSAYDLLGKLEMAHRRALKDPRLFGKQFYAEVNAHHYATFINHIATNRTRKLKKHSSCSSEIDELLIRMERNQVQYNSVLYCSLLKFYSLSYDLGRSFSLINPILEDAIENSKIPMKEQSVFYERRLITKSLHKRIWQVYRQLYKIQAGMRLDSESQYQKRWRKFQLALSNQKHTLPTVGIRDLFNILQSENILPSVNFYKIIIDTFLHSGDHMAIPAILTLMSEAHGNTLDKSFSKYVVVAMERTFAMKPPGLESEKPNKSEIVIEPNTYNQLLFQFLASLKQTNTNNHEVYLEVIGACKKLQAPVQMIEEAYKGCK